MSLTTPNQPTQQVPDWVTHDGTRYRAVVFETPVQTDIDTVWSELHDNYVDIQETHAAIVSSYGYDDEPATGLGAVRHCDIDFNGKSVSIDERIIDLVDHPDHREFTYDVYRTEGFPARVFNTWRVRRDPAGRTLLANVFYYRMKPAVLTRPMVGRMTDAARNGVLGFVHFFETGERNVPAEEILRRRGLAAA